VNNVSKVSRDAAGLTNPKDKLLVKTYYLIHSTLDWDVLRSLYDIFRAVWGESLGPRLFHRVRQGEFYRHVDEYVPEHAPEFYYWEYDLEKDRWLCKNSEGEIVYSGQSVLCRAQLEYRLRERQKRRAGAR
jgi:hypothetical protein